MVDSRRKQPANELTRSLMSGLFALLERKRNKFPLACSADTRTRPRVAVQQPRPRKLWNAPSVQRIASSRRVFRSKV
jgi:hypothetical protein